MQTRIYMLDFMEREMTLIYKQDHRQWDLNQNGVKECKVFQTGGEQYNNLNMDTIMDLEIQ